jgi:hypothetical protein
MPVDVWYHVAFVFNGKEGTGSIYADGKFSGSSSQFPKPAILVNETRHTNYFGATSVTNYVANMVIDEVKLFNKALTLEQVKIDKDNFGKLMFEIC